MGWIGSILTLVAKLAEWWTGKKKADAQAAHDFEVRKAQQTEDALKGESDALRQVDRVNASIDSGGVPVADDPNNRNR